MQRQDDFQITRDAMLAFIMQMLSLAGLAFKIAATNRHVDDLLLRSFLRSEHVMLVMLAGIMGNVDTRRDLPDLDQFELPPDSIDRHGELISIAASFQQIAMTLALILSMHPRAFRDRQRTPSSLLRCGGRKHGPALPQPTPPGPSGHPPLKGEGALNARAPP